MYAIIKLNSDKSTVILETSENSAFLNNKINRKEYQEQNKCLRDSLRVMCIEPIKY